MNSTRYSRAEVSQLEFRPKRVMVRLAASAILTLVSVILPILVVLAYSYSELSDVGSYVATHQEEIATKVNEAVRRLPFFKTSNISRWYTSFKSSAFVS